MPTDTTNKTFNIRVGEFQGSLEALLEMVQKRQVHINDVSLAQVADDYVAYVQGMQRVPSGEIASFIVVAATLLLIKSKSLLPSLVLSTEEEEDIKDLEERLQLYSIYKQAHNTLAQYVKGSMSLRIPKQRKVEKKIVFAPASNMQIESLHHAIHDVVTQLPQVNHKPKAEIPETIRMEDVMQNLLKRVESAVQNNFNAIAGSSKQEVLVNFLALLELVKDGVLLAEQNGTYANILITR